MIRILLFIGAWFGLMFASLQIQQIEMGHALCGKWGCGPPFEALLSMHLFWFALIFPPTLYACRCWALNWRAIGVGAVALSIVVLFVFAAADFMGENRGYYEDGYAWQRFLLSLASWINVPVIQILTLGFALIKYGRCPCCQKQVIKDNSESFRTDVV